MWDDKMLWSRPYILGCELFSKAFSKYFVILKTSSCISDAYLWRVAHLEIHNNASAKSSILLNVVYLSLPRNLVIVCRRVIGNRVSCCEASKDSSFSFWRSSEVAVFWDALQIKILPIAFELTSNRQLPLDRGQCSHWDYITFHLTENVIYTVYSL